MPPLGTGLYLLRNRARVVAQWVIVILAVLEVSTVALLTSSLAQGVELTMVAPLQYFSEVVASGVEVPQTIVSQVAAQPQSEAMIPIVTNQMRMNTLTGPTGANVFSMPVAEQPWFLRQIGERVVAGRLPLPGAAEIAVPRQVMRGRGLRLGDLIGQQIDPNAWLPGQWTIVGELGGQLEIGVTSYEAMRAVGPLADVPGATSYAVFAHPGTLHALDTYLATLPLNEVRVYTHGAEERAFQRDVRSLTLLVWCINLTTVGVLALATGLLNHLQYLQRMDEFGVLAAIGYGVPALIRRAMSEVAASTCVSWLLGLACSAVGVRMLQVWLFNPRGVSLPSLDWRDLAFTVPIPVLMAGFTLLTVVRRLGRLDPVSVVERRD